MKLEIRSDFEFLKARDVKVGDIVTILNEGEVREKDFGTGKPRVIFEIEVEHNKKKKIWTMNKKTIKKLIDKFGDDTKTWVGKKVKLNIVEVEVRGVTRNSIVGEPLDEEPKKEQVRVEVVKI